MSGRSCRPSLRRDAAQVEQREAERRVHERRLHVHARAARRTRSGRCRACAAALAIGASSGTMMKTISKKSRKNARKKTKMLTTIRKPEHAARQAGQQVLEPAAAVDALERRARTRVEPIRMKMTIAVSRMVVFARACMSSARSVAGSPRRARRHPSRRRRRARRCATWNGTDLNAKNRRSIAGNAGARRMPIQKHARARSGRGRDGASTASTRRADRSHGAGLGGRGEPEQQRAEHEEDQHAGGNDARAALRSTAPSRAACAPPSAAPAPTPA